MMNSISNGETECYDIFKKLADGSAAWICEVNSVLEARQRLKELERSDPADYYVCNLASRRVIGTATAHWPELHAGQGDPALFQ